MCRGILGCCGLKLFFEILVNPTTTNARRFTYTISLTKKEMRGNRSAQLETAGGQNAAAPLGTVDLSDQGLVDQRFELTLAVVVGTEDAALSTVEEAFHKVWIGDSTVMKRNLPLQFI